MRRLSPLRRSAPRILGAFVLTAASMLTSCREKDTAAPWEGETLTTEAAANEAKPASAPSPEPLASDSEAADGAIRFIAYNVENWLTMDRYVDREPVGLSPKPESEREIVTRIVASGRPDILGLCEVGEKEDLNDLQARLKEAGLDLPYQHHTGGVDETRHLALLSRFPIVETRTPEDLEYTLEGRTRGMGRGILDATVDTPAGVVRFLGVHLKSKREIPDGDQEMMRRAEAHLLRREVDQILTADPDAALIVYGDMNDTRNSSAMRTIKGPRNTPTSLHMAYLRDSRGESWTHHWSYQDVYSRIDYILVSTSMVDRVLWDGSRILEDPEWADGSDHRALLLPFK